MRSKTIQAEIPPSQLCAALHDQVLNAIVGLSVVAVLCMVVNAYFLLAVDLRLWFAGVATILVVRLALLVLYRNRTWKLRATDWIRLQSMLAVTLAALFAWVGLALMGEGGLTVTAVVSTILYGTATGAIPILGMVHRWYLVYIATLLAPIIILHISRPEDPSSAVFATSGVILLALLAAVSRNYARAVIRGNLSERDPLTNCSNRRLVDRTLQTRRMPDGSHPAALAMLDLDRFKTINDTAGHEAGDRVLVDLANTLRELTDEQDEVCRIGGDEFAILFASRPDLDVDLKLENIRETLADKRFRWNNNTFRITASIGAVVFDDNVDCRPEAMAKADMAAYVAKKRGGNRIRRFSHADRELVEDQQDLIWRTRVENALESDGLSLACQEIHRMGLGRRQVGDSPSVGLELLVRLQDEHGKRVMAGEFVPAVERLGLSANLDRWVVSRALRWVHENRDVVDSMDWVSINLSINSLTDTGFCDLVESLSRDYQIDNRMIMFELSEHEAILDYRNVVTFMDRLSSLGFGFALDDFGTGYSSLQCLKDLKIDLVKVDRTFIREITTSREDQTMLYAINQLCKGLGKAVVAEGIEDDSTLEKIRSLGVDYIQGHVLQSPEQLDSWTLKRRARQAERRAPGDTPPLAMDQ